MPAVIILVCLSVSWLSLSIFSWWRAIRAWRDPRYSRDVWNPLQGGPSEPVVRGHIRGLVPFAVFVSGIFGYSVGMTLGSAGGPAGRVAADVVLASASGAVLGAVLQLTILWFNWPRLLVLPHMRDEVGTVTARRRARNSGQSRP